MGQAFHRWAVERSARFLPWAFEDFGSQGLRGLGFRVRGLGLRGFGFGDLGFRLLHRFHFQDLGLRGLGVYSNTIRARTSDGWGPALCIHKATIRGDY